MYILGFLQQNTCVFLLKLRSFFTGKKYGIFYIEKLRSFFIEKYGIFYIEKLRSFFIEKYGIFYREKLPSSFFMTSSRVGVHAGLGLRVEL